MPAGDSRNNQKGKASAGRALLLRPSTAEKLLAVLERLDLEPDPQQFDRFTRSGKVFFRYRQTASADASRGGGGRFVPYIGGAAGTSLFLTPGTVRYCRVAEEDPGDSAPTEGQQIAPVFPTLEGTALNAEDPPFFDISARSSCSLWLITDRLRCPRGTFVPSEDSTETERVEIRDKGSKPPKADGELHTLLCELDFATGSGGSKSISSRDIRIASDLDVWFKCLSDDSSDSITDSIGSSDIASSDESDDPESSGDSGSRDCPWAAKAAWYRKQRCYQENRTTYIVWKVAIGITTLFTKCEGGWEARISMPGGTPIPYAGQRAEGTLLVVPLLERRQVFGARFRFTLPPACEATSLRVSIFGDSGDDSTPHECCDRNFVKTFAETWPHYCGSTCTTVVTPPP